MKDVQPLSGPEGKKKKKCKQGKKEKKAKKGKKQSYFDIPNPMRKIIIP